MWVYPVLKAVFCSTNLNNLEKSTDCLQIDMRKTLWKAISVEMTIDYFFLIYVAFNINEILSRKQHLFLFMFLSPYFILLQSSI